MKLFTTLKRKLRAFRQLWRDDRKLLLELCLLKLKLTFRKKIIGIYETANKPSKHLLMSYIVSPFLLNENSAIFQTHQNKWQAHEIVRIFNTLGFNVDIYDYRDTSLEPSSYEKYDALFGMGQNFQRFAEGLDDQVLKIYYATGMHWSQRNEAERRRLDRLEARKGVKLKPRRQLPETESENMTSALVVVGDSYTKGTYTNYVGCKPAYTVRISGFDFLECDLKNKDFELARKSFLWFGNTGFVLKGLDLVLEVFTDLKDLDIYICGPIESEEDFTNVYFSELYQTRNIHTLNIAHVKSEQFMDICRKCAYIVYPSASEGIPGAVITCMHMGLVPIVTKESIFEVEGWGISLQDSNLHTIKETVIEAARKDPEVIKEMSRRACKQAKQNYTKETFRKDMERALTNIIDGQPSKRYS